jgi:hypothetical protein
MAHTWVGNAIARTLAALELHELSISAHRRELHGRIDALYINAPLAEEQIALLDLLEDEERDISAQRRRLHEQVDELRRRSGVAPLKPSPAPSRSLVARTNRR